VADAAGGKDDGARRKRDRRAAGRRPGDDTRDVLAVSEDRLADIAFPETDRRRLPHRVDQRLHDGGAGHVAADVDDAALAVRRLARQGEMALEVVVEGHAIGEEVVDAGRRVGHQQARDLLVDRSGPGDERVGEVLLDRIARRHGGGDAALRPGRGGALLLDRRRRRTVTGRGARRSAREEPASPPPTMITSSGAWGRRRQAIHHLFSTQRHPGGSRSPSKSSPSGRIHPDCAASDGFRLSPE
jgi:hypothetical protein